MGNNRSSLLSNGKFLVVLLCQGFSWVFEAVVPTPLAALFARYPGVLKAVAPIAVAGAFFWRRAKSKEKSNERARMNGPIGGPYLLVNGRLTQERILNFFGEINKERPRAALANNYDAYENVRILTMSFLSSARYLARYLPGYLLSIRDCMDDADFGSSEKKAKVLSQYMAAEGQLGFPQPCRGIEFIIRSANELHSTVQELRERVNNLERVVAAMPPDEPRKETLFNMIWFSPLSSAPAPNKRQSRDLAQVAEEENESASDSVASSAAAAASEDVEMVPLINERRSPMPASTSPPRRSSRLQEMLMELVDKLKNLTENVSIVSGDFMIASEALADQVKCLSCSPQEFLEKLDVLLKTFDALHKHIGSIFDEHHTVQEDEAAAEASKEGKAIEPEPAPAAGQEMETV